MKVRTAKRLAVVDVAVVAFSLLASAGVIAGALVAWLAGLRGIPALLVVGAVSVPVAGGAKLASVYERTVGEHLRVAPGTWEAMRAAWPMPAQPIPHGGRIGHLAGIAVMVDTALPAGAWQLVDTATGNVVEEGRGDPC